MNTAEILEFAMIAMFGASWPMNALKSWQARTAKGKSFAFLILIFTGYVCGITSKLLAERVSWGLLAVYIFNEFWVSVDLLLYFRNRALDRAAR